MGCLSLTFRSPLSLTRLYSRVLLAVPCSLSFYCPSSHAFRCLFQPVFLMISVAAGAPTAQALLVVPGPEAQAAGETKSAPQIRLKALREVRATSLLARNGGRRGGDWWRCAVGEVSQWISRDLTYYDDGKAKNIG